MMNNLANTIVTAWKSDTLTVEEIVQQTVAALYAIEKEALKCKVAFSKEATRAFVALDAAYDKDDGHCEGSKAQRAAEQRANVAEQWVDDTEEDCDAMHAEAKMAWGIAFALECDTARRAQED